MSLDIKIRNLEAMTLAFIYGPDEVEINALLDEFLLSNNVDNARRFHSKMVIKNRGHEKVTYMKYAQVPEGTSKMNHISIVSLPKANYMYIQLSEEEYNNMNNDEVAVYMKENDLQVDYSKVFALVEDVISDSSKFNDVYFYVKKK